jgi:hypothetical protein
MRILSVRSVTCGRLGGAPLLPLFGLLALIGVGALPSESSAQGGGAQLGGGGYSGYAIPSVPPHHRAGLPRTPPVPPGFPSRPVDFARNRISSFTGASTTGTLSGNQGGGALGGQGGGIGGAAGQGGGFGGLGGGGFGGLGGGGGLGGLGGGGFGGLGGGGLGGLGGGGGFGGLGGGGGFGGGKQFGFDGGSLFDVQPTFRHGVGLGGGRSAMDGGASSSEARALRNPAADFEPQARLAELNCNSYGAELRQAKSWALPAAH